MSVQSTCFHCQHPNLFDDKWAGKVMRCQKCGGIITLPKLDAPVPPRADLAAVAQAYEPPAVFRPMPETAASRPVARPPVEKPQQPAPRAAPGLAATFSIANGVVMLVIAAGAALIAIPSTRASILEKLHAAPIPPTQLQIAWIVTAIALLLGVFYVVCAGKMRRDPAFAKAAASAAFIQAALQIGLLVYMTFHGQLNHACLAAATLSLIALCALIDFACRGVRAPAAAIAAVG